ncbi:MAG: hypothetical protein IKG18_14225 [Atopobiaceae bacterium]|nr:hypothetical protein [Atopobiaceae bacterium]
MSRMTIEDVLDESKIMVAKTDDGWVKVKEFERTKTDDGGFVIRAVPDIVTYTQVGENLIRATARTGVFVSEENRLALSALTGHLSGWMFKIAEFGMTNEGEVTIFYDREIGGAESPHEMYVRLKKTVDETSEKLQAIASGKSPQDAAGVGKGLGRRSDLVRQLLGRSLSGLLGE